MIDQRFNELLEDYADGQIANEDARELLDAFKADQSLRARFVEELKLINSVQGLPLIEDEDRIPDEVIRSILPEESSRDLSEAVLEDLRPPSKSVFHRAVFKQVATMAAALIVSLVVLFAIRESESSLAVVVHQDEASWAEGQEFATGAGLAKQRLTLLSGLVRLDFPKGVRVTLEGPAELELISWDEARLHSGDLTAHVPPEGIGFQVHTSSAKVVDLGTTFGISVDDEGGTDVAVYEGEVEVTSLASLEEKIIYEGNLVSVGESSASLNPVRLQSRTFRSWPVLFGVVNTGGNIRFVNAQPVANPVEVIDAENIVIFPERFGAKIKSDLVVTLLAPGNYESADLVGREDTLKGKGQRVDTYLLQYNPPHVDGVPNSDQKNFRGEVTFDRPVVAIIADRDQLAVSDGLFGKRRFEYPNSPARALEHGDVLSLSQDRKTLEVDWLVMQSLKRGMDQIRVFVDANEGRGN